MGLSSALALAAVASVLGAVQPVQQLERVSVNSRGIQGNGNSGAPLLSPNGSLAVFRSAANNLVRRDRNGREDIFVRDRARGRTERLVKNVSIAAPGANPFYFDGRWLGFAKYANGNHYFVRDLQSGATMQLDLYSSGRSPQLWLEDAPAVSSMTAHFAFTTFDAGRGDAAIQVYVRDRVAAATTLVSTAMGGRPGNGESHAPAISADGRYVAFHSSASDLVPHDTNGQPDVFVRDRATNTTSRVSINSAGAQSDGSSTLPAVSADGRFVLFTSDARNLVPGDTNSAMDIFLHDRVTGATSRVSVSSTGAQARGDSFQSAFAGPRLIQFSSNATNLVPGDTNRRFDGFLRDLATGTTVPATVGPPLSRTASPLTTFLLAFSADGLWIGFNSSDGRHVRRDTNRRADAFVYGPLTQPWVLAGGSR